MLRGTTASVSKKYSSSYNFFHKKLSRASVFRIHVSQQINSLSNVLTIAKILVVVVLNLLQVGFCSLWEQI